MLRIIFSAAILLIVFIITTGILYPLAVTGFAQLFFPFQANGSVIIKNNRPIGSILIGQNFDDPKYFWGRPSATLPYPYNASSSSGSNMGPSNPALLHAVRSRISNLKSVDTRNDKPVPIDLVTTSGSGLDPHISAAAAEYQIRRVAHARGIEESKVRYLVLACTEKRQFGILGEPGVNVLLLNIALDEMH
ncbi:MAG: potassium-transporting ATPase subunit C [Nitrospirae bacterium RBG_13_41_22]|nr:MAG: potassium-transporting ATPase subunit C [Nitrospirae bacterium RBG_13_41_22]OHE56257.1 MAG: potassium-transporting ATPase subunit C [Thermodesulfovibrio sp. RBG_19FT_COMBO_42_12]